MVVEAATRR